MTQIDGPVSGSALALDEMADADLVLRTRSGSRDAFGELWRRHYRSGISVARSITSSLEADDLVQEAYTRIYQSILKGGGPTGSFRAYLFTSIRNTAAAWGRARKETAVEEMDAVEDPASSDEATADALDRGLTAQAFRSLPTRWQEVLWYSEIEQMKPAEIAPLLGMKATAVAQLAFRAREGLREAWIQAHLRSVAEDSDCAWTIGRLGAYARGNLGARDKTKIENHLADCARCAIVAGEAKEVSSRLALVLLPLTIGVGATAAYLATLQGVGAPVVALAAMPSSVMPGAVVAGSGATSTAGSGSGGAGAGGMTTATGAAGGAAATTGVGALVGIAAAAIVVIGAVVAAALVPGLLFPTPTTSDVQAPVQAPVTQPQDPADVPAPLPSTAAEPDDVVDESEPGGGSTDPGGSTTPNGSTNPGGSKEPEGSGNPGGSTDPEDPGTDPEDPGTDPADPDTDPEPEDPGTDPSGPVLPAGSPAVTGSRAYFTGIRLNVAITVSGQPGATVQALISGRVRATATVGEAGSATLVVRPTALQVVANSNVGLRYVAGSETGPLANTRLSRLMR